MQQKVVFIYECWKPYTQLTQRALRQNRRTTIFLLASFVIGLLVALQYRKDTDVQKATKLFKTWKVFPQ